MDFTMQLLQNCKFFLLYVPAIAHKQLPEFISDTIPSPKIYPEKSTLANLAFLSFVWYPSPNKFIINSMG